MDENIRSCRYASIEVLQLETGEEYRTFDIAMDDTSFVDRVQAHGKLARNRNNVLLIKFIICRPHLRHIS